MELKFITVQFSEEQNEFWRWCLLHYKQLKKIKNSKGLDMGGSSFTTHLKCVNDEAISELDKVPDIEKIQLHWNYNE